MAHTADLAASAFLGAFCPAAASNQFQASSVGKRGKTRQRFFLVRLRALCVGGSSFLGRSGWSLTSGYWAIANLRAGRSSGGSTNAAVAVSIAAQKGTQPLARANESQTKPPTITKIGRAQRFQMKTGIASR